MTFLNPLVLFGLVAAAIPVLLHLLNLRKLRTIEFSTLTFLKELQQTKIRRLKLRQLLLLIIRTLLVIFVVLAFARPALKGTMFGSIGSDAHSTVVFILDDSFSMVATDERGELFRQAKEALTGALSLLKSGDEAYLIRLSDLPKATVNPATHDFDALRKLVEESAISAVTRPMAEALQLAAALLSGSRNANREAYVISDMQRTTILGTAAGSEARNHNFPEGTQIFLVPIGSKAAVNVAIDSVEVLTSIVEKNKPVRVYASARNFSAAPVNDYVVSVFLEGVRAAQHNVSIEAWGSAAMEFSIAPGKSGFARGYIELENDAIEHDNRRYFSVFVPERIDVLMVAGSAAESQFPLLAMQAGSSEGELVHVQQSSPQRFALASLNDIDVVICAGPGSLSPADGERLKNFVERGGTLILFPDANGNVTDPGNILAALKIPAIEGKSGAPLQQTGMYFKTVDWNHPLLSTIFEKQERSQEIQSPQIHMALKRRAGSNGHTIIGLSDGTPFLSEHKAGMGRVLFYSVAPVLQWSDFPLKGLFAPLMYRSVIYSSAQTRQNDGYSTGDMPFITMQEIRAYASGPTGSGQFKLAGPDGMEELVQQVSTSGGLGFQIPQLTRPGSYELRQDQQLLTVINANINPRESDCRKAEEADFTALWKGFNLDRVVISTISPGDQVQGAILQSRFGIELWKYCIAFALALALLEMLIARENKQPVQQTA